MLQFEAGQVIALRIISNSKIQSIQKEDSVYKVRLKSIPLKGKANKELKSYFKSLGYNIELVSGEKAHNKLIKITKVLK